MAYDSAGTAFDLTSLVDDEGILKWIAPRDNWKVIALFSANHGKMVERAAPGAEGYAIDHFAEPALMQYLQYFDSAFGGADIRGIRCMFNDSYEVDDAFGQADWTASLPDEFIKRRGYDLFQYLPALLSNNDSTPAVRRLIYDYRLTISEMLLERFTLPWRRWTNSHGAFTRNQAHGSPANILDLYAASDIPETEGNDILRFKFASSAGNVLGKKLISAETATWLNDHFVSTLADVKKAADKCFLSGVNHLIYHGTAYSPVDEPWPGWLFYAAVHFQPTNPMWEHFPALNYYIARTQSLLQQGSPDNDILLYYPIADRFSDRGNQLLRHFDGMEEFGGTGFETCARQLLEKGYMFDFISDLQLLQTSVQNNLIHSGTTTYQTIIVPNCRYMPFESWQHLFDLAMAGANVIFYKSAPIEVPGLKTYEKFQPDFLRLKQLLIFKEIDDNGIQKATYGKGMFVLAGDLPGMLKHAGVRQETFTDQQIQFVRRKLDNNTLYFISNNGQHDVDGWIPLQCKAATATLFDAYTGRNGKAAIRRRAKGTPEIYIKLKPSASMLIMACPEETTGEPFPFYQPSGTAIPIGKTWTVDFIRGGPVLPPQEHVKKLTSWIEWGKETETFSGLARYTTSFRNPSTKANHYLLNLDNVYDCARVRINGEPVASLVGPDFSVVIDASVLQKKNTIEVFVANRMANRIIDMDKKGLNYKKFHNVNFPAYKRENTGTDGLFSTAQWKPFPAGLTGPVTLTPMEKVVQP